MALVLSFSAGKNEGASVLTEACGPGHIVPQHQIAGMQRFPFHVSTLAGNNRCRPLNVKRLLWPRFHQQMFLELHRQMRHRSARGSHVLSCDVVNHTVFAIFQAA
jgi:hypothetical protein